MDCLLDANVLKWPLVRCCQAPIDSGSRIGRCLGEVEGNLKDGGFYAIPPKIAPLILLFLIPHFSHLVALLRH